MSGGSWEYVMGNYNDVIGGNGFTTMPELKYYDKYTSDNIMIACNGGECLSHSLSETSGLYNDTHNMISLEYPWLTRSGGYNDSGNTGVFYFNFGNGVSSSSSFRNVICLSN